MTESLPTSKSSLKKHTIIIFLLLLVIVALLIWMIPSMQKLNSLVKEKEQQRVELQNELQALIVRHDSIKTIYGTFADSLRVKDSIIQADAREIQELLNYKWEYGKINHKLDLLRKITQGYVHQIDSLYTVNLQLRQEKDQIMQQYADEQKKTEELTRDKEDLMSKVSNAAQLKAYNITAIGIRMSGVGKEKETDKAGKIEKVKVCFILSANKLVVKGNKNVYLRIARPDNVIVSQRLGDVYTFEYQGKLIEYTSKKEIDYQNEAMPLCLYWTKKSAEEPAMVGKYNVSLFVDGYEIGQAFFELF
jgi:competence protein ComGC